MRAGADELSTATPVPETWELTASPLTNKPWHETILRPGQPSDPYIVGEFAEANYGVLDVDLRRWWSIHPLSKRREPFARC